MKLGIVKLSGLLLMMLLLSCEAYRVVISNVFYKSPKHTTHTFSSETLTVGKGTGYL